MILGALSVLDFLVAAILAFAQLSAVHWLVLVYAASYLVVKTVFFWDNWMSWGDAIVAAWLLLMVLGASGVFTWFCVAWLLYKVVYALAS